MHGMFGTVIWDIKMEAGIGYMLANFAIKILLIEPLGCTGTWATKVESTMSFIILGCLYKFGGSLQRTRVE
jgi:hypothetical protein